MVMAAALFVFAGCTGPAPKPRPTATGQRATSPSPTPTPSPTPAVYQAVIGLIPPAVAAEMVGVSWRPGCPVPMDQLRVITLVYYGFDGTIHSGELVAHADLAPAVVRIFGKLFDARFPIR